MSYIQVDNIIPRYSPSISITKANIVNVGCVIPGPYANNALAIKALLVAGDIYINAVSDPQKLCIVFAAE